MDIVFARYEQEVKKLPNHLTQYKQRAHWANKKLVECSLIMAPFFRYKESGVYPTNEEMQMAETYFNITA
jgi:hypothetical protein